MIRTKNSSTEALQRGGEGGIFFISHAVDIRWPLTVLPHLSNAGAERCTARQCFTTVIPAALIVVKVISHPCVGGGGVGGSSFSRCRIARVKAWKSVGGYTPTEETDTW